MLISFALTQDNRVLVGVTSGVRPVTFLRTRLRATDSEGTLANWKTVVSVAPGRGTNLNVLARPISPEEVRAADGGPLEALEWFSELSTAGRDSLASAMQALSYPAAPAFTGSPDDGRAIARCLAGLLGLPFYSHPITDDTRFRDLSGHHLNPRTIFHTEFSICARDGGCFLVDVPELTSAVGRTLMCFETFLPCSSEKLRYDLEHLGYPEGFQPHEDFVLIFNLPDPHLGPPVRGGIAREAHFIWVEAGSAGRRVEHVHVEPMEAGPGSVLVLMKFNIPVYETWFREVVEPVVADCGTCIRIERPLAEWRTDMRRLFERADATIIDLSYDVLGEISPHIVWEMTEIVAFGRLKGTRRQRILCAARGLEHVQGREDDPDFVWLKDVGPRWVPLKQRSLDAEELLGLRIRRYNPLDPGGRNAFQAWLRSSIEPWIQGARPSVSDSEIKRRAIQLGERHSPNWGQFEPLIGETHALRRLRQLRLPDDPVGILAMLTANRDIDACYRVVADGQVPEVATEVLGCLLASVTAAETHRYNGYWPLANRVLAGSTTLQDHILRVLSTRHIHLNTWWTNQYRIRAWRCLRTVRLPVSERRTLQILYDLENDDIQLDAFEVLRPYLPPDQEQRARLRFIARGHGIDRLPCDVCGQERDIHGSMVCENGHLLCSACKYSWRLFGSVLDSCPLCAEKLKFSDVLLGDDD